MPLEINGERLEYANERWDMSKDSKPPRTRRDANPLVDPRTGEELRPGASNPDDYGEDLSPREAERLANEILSEPIVARREGRPEEEW